MPVALANGVSSQSIPPVEPNPYDAGIALWEGKGEMLVATDLWKSYGDKAAVCGVSLAVAARRDRRPARAERRGQVDHRRDALRARRGPIAAAVDAWRARRIGDEASPAKRRIGLVPQDISLYEELRRRGQPELFGALYGIEAATCSSSASHAALELVGLADRAKAQAGDLQRRHEAAPQPRRGAAARSRRSCCSTSRPSASIRRAATPSSTTSRRSSARGKALLYTTHYMEEAERLCDRIVIIDHGKVIASGTRADVCARCCRAGHAALRDRGRDRRGRAGAAARRGA